MPAGGRPLGPMAGNLPAVVARPLVQIQALGGRRIVALGLVALAFAAFFAFLIGRALETRYTLLYADLDLGASQEIVRRLEALGVPYRLGGAGDSVFVPSEEALRLRMSLAEEGLPGGGTVGYEIFDNADPFGTTEFLSNVNLKRALEGELARTIGSMRQVRSARVHLVQPKRELFQREKTKPSASVFLSLRVAGGLDRREIGAIQHLVASSVPGLDAKGVTILDDAGDLLARGGQDAADGLLMDEADDYKVSLEERLKRKVVTLLERTIGRGRVDAQVTALVDFDEVTTTQETYDPEGQVVRSTQTVEEQRDASEKAAKEGVSVANNLPAERNQQAGGGDASQEQTNRTEETVNYEVSRTVKNQLKRGGRIERLSVAVQVDGVYAPATDGTLAFQPRDAQELAQLETLVRTALGLDEERGDTVSILSRQFIAVEPEAAPEETLLDFSRADLLGLVEPAVLLVVSILTLLFGVRPLLRRLLPEQEKASLETVATTGSELSTLAGDAPPAALAAGDAPGAAGEQPEGMVLQNIEGRVHAALVQDVTGLIQSRPEDAVGVIRGWLLEG
ncbi:MAG: flagellar M-ring protein FliF [Geminicoccaceae bacterium]|nr:flagellar M-ring protein FliF [Geminicoccaceae bacterium]